MLINEHAVLTMMRLRANSAAAGLLRQSLNDQFFAIKKK